MFRKINEIIALRGTEQNKERFIEVLRIALKACKRLLRRIED
jgi:hypothetical protein